MFKSSFENNDKTIDDGLNAIRVLSAGFPVVVAGCEYIMIDKIYIREPIMDDSNECNLIGPELNQLDFMAHVNANVSPDESIEIVNKLMLTSRSTVSIPLIISALQKDFLSAIQSKIIVNEIIWSKSHTTMTLNKPLYARIDPGTGPLYKAVNAHLLGSNITRIDSAWDIHIPDIEYPQNEKPFVWGTGISLDGKVENPSCMLIEQTTYNDDCNLSI